MVEFIGKDLRGSRFRQVDLTASRFNDVDLTGAHIRGALMVDVDIDAHLENVRINGVDIGPLVEAELDRLYPERAKLRPSTADGFREAWAVIEKAWPSTVERAQRLAPELLHERVD